jgi:hypothetical protein
MQNKKIIPLILIAAAIISMTVAIHYWVTFDVYLFQRVIGFDWRLYIQPAGTALLHGQSPFTIPGYYNPPWLLLLTFPLSLIPITWSVSVMVSLNFAAWTYTALRLKVHAYWVIPLVIFSGAGENAIKGNIDGLLSLALFLPPWASVLIMMIKPQLGLPVAVFYGLSILLDGSPLKARIGKLAKLTVPFMLAFGLSVLVYGDWFIQSAGAVTQPWNSAPWPHAVVVGLFLIWQAVSRRDVRWALIAIPFVTPYFHPDSWALSTAAAMGVVNLPNHPNLKNT